MDAKAVADYDYEGYVKAQNTKANTNIPGSALRDSVNYFFTFQKFLDQVKESKLYADIKVSGADISQNPSAPATTTPNDGSVKDMKLKKTNQGDYEIDLQAQENYLESYIKAVDSSLRDGALYAIFAVDYVGPVSESFSNSTNQIGIGQGINQIGGASRDMRFNMAGGNIAGMLKGATDLMGDFVKGVLNSISFGLDSVVQTLTGGGFIDLPDKWDNSDTSFPDITYKMELRSSSGDVISQLQNIYIPLHLEDKSFFDDRVKIVKDEADYIIENRYIHNVDNVIKNLYADRAISGLIAQTQYELSIRQSEAFELVKNPNKYLDNGYIVDLVGKGNHKYMAKEISFELEQKLLNNSYDLIDKSTYYNDLQKFDISSHDFRFTAARDKFENLLKSGISQKEAKLKISQELNHKREAITDYYLRRTE